MSSRSGSSRRKPLVTRKVFDNSTDEEEDDAARNDSQKVNGDSQSEEDIPEELPEGTVVVNPEPVEEKNPTFKGPEFVSGKRKVTGNVSIDVSGLMSRVTCTACHKQINTNKKGSARRHPLLKVLICKRCRTYYDSGPIQKDKDGLDEQCRWCGEGGRLFGCDFCHNAFCRSCIIHNLGRSELMRVQNDDKWKCYVCNSKSLRSQRHECEAVLEQIKKEEQKAKNALEREKEREKNKDKKDTSSKSPAVKSGDIVKTAASSKSVDTKQSNVKTTTSKNVEVVVVGPKTPVQPKPSMKIEPQQKAPVQQQLKNLLNLAGGQQYNAQQKVSPVKRIQQQKQQPRPMMSRVGFISSLDPTSITLPMLIKEFKKNITPTTIPQVLNKLMSITNSLTLLMSSIKMNIMDNNFNRPGYESLNAMTIQSRKTAVDCLVSGLELFLQELQITTVGEYVQPPPESVDIAGANGSSADMNNAGNGDDSEPEVVEIDSPAKTPKKSSLKMTMINNEIIVESDSEEEVTPVKMEVSQTDSVEKETIKGEQEMDDKISKDEGISDEAVEDKLTVEKSSKKVDKEKMDKKTEVSKDINKKKADKKSREESPKKQSNVKKEGPKKAKKSGTEDSDKVDSENTEAQLELLKELADELIKNGNKSDSESENDSEGEDNEDSQNIENGDEDDETSKKGANETEDDSDSKIVSSDGSNGITNPEENSAEDKGDQKESDDEKEVEKENNDEEEEDKNRPVSSASSNAESDSDSEDSDNSGPRRRLRKRKCNKDEKPEKKGKGSLKIRLRLPGKTKSQKENEDKKSDRRSSHSKTEEESQESEEENKGKKGKTKKKEKESDSENFDSDLEDEIDKLAKDPKIQKKKKKSDEEEKPSKEKKKDLKGEKDKKTKGKKEEKVDSDSSEGTDNYDPEEAPDEEEEEEPMEAVDPTSDISARENSSDEDNENNEDSDDSSDSEVIINSPKKKRGKATSKKAKKSESDPDSDSDAVPKKKTRLHTKLLDAKLSESDDSDFELPRKGKGKKRRAKTDSSSQESTEVDSDVASKKKLRGKKGANQKGKGKKGKGTKRRRIKVASDSSDEKMSTEGEEEMKNEKKKKKKKKGGSDSEEDSDEEGDENGSPSKGRKQIRKIKSDKKLTDSTRKAVKAEEERRKRIAEKQKEFNNVVVEEDPSAPNKCPITKKLVFEYDKETKEPLIEVDERLITKLKPHQVEAAQFMWDCTVESVERIKKEKGAGCILAHCMGLGKTLSVITFLHTVMNHSDQTGISKALVVGPLNTVLNWQQEFQIWLSGELGEEFYEVFEISGVKQNVARADMLKHWHKNGGVMIMGYEMFRNLTQGNHCRSKKLKQIFREALVDPGPDICVCDEGHILKNDASAISKAMNQLVTLRRIVLTGTPLQNNLIEYHCMVNFVKPNLLGTRKEFCNRFVNPIVNGQCTDSSAHDVRLMKRRAHIIHEKLAGCVQRKDYSALTKFLSPKFEYVISVRLSKVQIELYQKYLDKTGSVNSVMGKGAKLFSDYQALMRIWTHPWVLKMDEVRQEKKAKWDDEDSFIEDGSMSEDESGSELSKSNDSDSDVVAISDNSSDEDSGGRKTRSSREAGSSKDTDEVVVNSKGEVVKKWTTRSRGGEGCEWEGIIKAAEEEEDRPLTTDWWADYVTEEDANRIELSGKLTLLFEILRMSEEIGDKVLVFSQSLLSLDLIEDFLEYIDKKHQEETEEKEKKRKEAEEEEKKKSDEEKDEEDKEEETKDEEKAKPEEDTPEENVFGKQWTKGADYFRMDGSTSAQQRKDLAAAFNDPENYRARLFIISTKAGGLGINLVAANRVIIFDASWNPSNDVQSVFRVYRFGQTKPVYIYRFLAQGTMEEKIYERQVTKQSLSQRVVDEHQIERHFNSHDLQVLYTFKPDRLDDPNREERPTPELPKDHMLAEMLQSHKDWICAYHKHDSLLENQIDEELTEEERKAAWKEFEDEKKGIMNNVRQQFMGMNNMPGMHPGMAPNINMNMLMQQGLRLPHMGGMPSSNMPFNQQNLLQLVQDMKTRFPHLPEDQLTARVQGVIRHIITNQYMQQQEMQKRQLEQREMQHQQQLHQIQAQIQRQQQQLNAHQRMGGHPGQMPNRR